MPTCSLPPRASAALLVLCVFLAACQTPVGDPGPARGHAPAGNALHITGELLSINGATEVPIGLFGVHATPLSERIVGDWGIEAVRTIELSPKAQPVLPGVDPRVPRNVKLVVETWWDRYQPALRLTDRNWEQTLTNLARAWGQATKKTGRVHYLEFWNEPFINWASSPGVNYDGDFYDSSQGA